MGALGSLVDAGGVGRTGTGTTIWAAGWELAGVGGTGAWPAV